jgi:hypothetical protein
MARRSFVSELLAAGPYVLVLVHSGLCCAFDAVSGAWLCDVNADAGDVVRSIFFNRRRGELLVVSCHAGDAFRSLRCRAVPLRWGLGWVGWLAGWSSCLLLTHKP